ncbi:PIN domain-containing protein [Candidatus Peregrinibacteria bacterium]|nr:PIN domain-containing protein [Candidatus Peregrinibacteria bacterium]
MVKEPTELEKLLNDFDTVSLDTVIFIYLLEGENRYSEFLKKLFSFLELNNKKISFSALLLVELLVRPYQNNDLDIAKEWMSYFKMTPNIEIIDLTPTIAVDAAFLRAKYNIKTPDSIHLATAMQKSEAVLLTNDSALKKIEEVKVLCLKDFT